MNKKHKGIFLKIGDKFKDMNGSEYIIENEVLLENNFNKGNSDSDKFWIVRKMIDKSKFNTFLIKKMSDLFLQGEIFEKRAFLI